VPYRVDIYVGSDNDSGRINKSYLKKIREWADEVFPHGYTLLKGTGCYKGASEESIIINVLCENNAGLSRHLKYLKRDLEQEAILVTKSFVDFEVV